MQVFLFMEYFVKNILSATVSPIIRCKKRKRNDNKIPCLVAKQIQKKKNKIECLKWVLKRTISSYFVFFLMKVPGLNYKHFSYLIHEIFYFYHQSFCLIHFLENFPHPNGTTKLKLYDHYLFHSC